MTIFGKAEYELLIELKISKEAYEKRIAALESDCDAHKQEIDGLKMVLGQMVWASSKVALLVGGGFGGLVAFGYWLIGWLNDTMHWKAVSQFFRTLRGE